MKICIDYVFEYFTNYLNITEVQLLGELVGRPQKEEWSSLKTI